MAIANFTGEIRPNHLPHDRAALLERRFTKALNALSELEAELRFIRTDFPELAVPVQDPQAAVALAYATIDQAFDRLSVRPQDEAPGTKPAEPSPQTPYRSFEPTYRAPNPSASNGLFTLLRALGDLREMGRTTDGAFRQVFNCDQASLGHLRTHCEETRNVITDGISALGCLLYWASGNTEFGDIPAGTLRDIGLLIRDLSEAARPLSELEWQFSTGVSLEDCRPE